MAAVSGSLVADATRYPQWGPWSASGQPDGRRRPAGWLLRTTPAQPGRRPVQWVMVHVTEAYIHCSKHIPKLIPQSRVRHWGTDNPRQKGGDYFGVAASKQATAQPKAESHMSCSV